MVPLSLILACLLNLDSTKSPVLPSIETINDHTIQWVIDKKSMVYEIIIAAITVKKTPPIKPSIVFFGDTLSNNFLLPKFLPTKKAKLSFTQMKITKDRIMDSWYSPFTTGNRIRKAKDKSKYLMLMSIF